VNELGSEGNALYMDSEEKF